MNDVERADEIASFAEANKSDLQAIFKEARISREKHTIEDRLFALEIMISALVNSVKDIDDNAFVEVMESYITVNDPFPNNDPKFKATADLYKLPADLHKEIGKLRNR